MFLLENNPSIILLSSFWKGTATTFQLTITFRTKGITFQQLLRHCCTLPPTHERENSNFFSDHPNSLEKWSHPSQSIKPHQSIAALLQVMKSNCETARLVNSTSLPLHCQKTRARTDTEDWNTRSLQCQGRQCTPSASTSHWTYAELLHPMGIFPNLQLTRRKCKKQDTCIQPVKAILRLPSRTKP